MCIALAQSLAADAFHLVPVDLQAWGEDQKIVFYGFSAGRADFLFQRIQLYNRVLDPFYSAGNAVGHGLPYLIRLEYAGCDKCESWLVILSVGRIYEGNVGIADTMHQSCRKTASGSTSADNQYASLDIDFIKVIHSSTAYAQDGSCAKSGF